jgi:hypothetical protein
MALSGKYYGGSYERFSSLRTRALNFGCIHRKRAGLSGGAIHLHHDPYLPGSPVRRGSRLIAEFEVGTSGGSRYWEFLMRPPSSEPHRRFMCRTAQIFVPLWPYSDSFA